jgi:hypothetical protein
MTSDLGRPTAPEQTRAHRGVGDAVRHLSPMMRPSGTTPHEGAGDSFDADEDLIRLPWEATFGYSRAVRVGDQDFVGVTVGRNPDGSPATAPLPRPGGPWRSSEPL